MSKSPKALLPSSLSLASFSRALPAANAVQRQSASIASTSAAKRAATANGHAVDLPAASEAAGRPPQSSRPASPLSTQPARRSTHAGRVASHRAVYASSSSSSSSRSSAGPLLRRARSVAASPTSGHYYPSFTDASSSVCASSSSVAGPSRYFHSAHCTRHQQAISPASGGGGGGIVPPPGSEHHASSSGALGGGAGGPSGADGPFQAKHHSSLPLASHDGPTLLPGSVAPSSGSGSSPPTALDAASSSTTPASASQTHQHHSSSTSSNAIPATLFSHAPPASLPSHALPAFFGSALNIARRSNLVFRNGAYGIPKADHHRARVSAKGKEKAISLAEASDAEHYLSVGVGEDAVRLYSYLSDESTLTVFPHTVLLETRLAWRCRRGRGLVRSRRRQLGAMGTQVYAPCVPSFSLSLTAPSLNSTLPPSIDCSAELARYENVDDDMFLHYYEVDPVDVMQRAYEKTLSECKEEVRSAFFSIAVGCRGGGSRESSWNSRSLTVGMPFVRVPGDDRLLDCASGHLAERRAAVSQPRRLLVLRDPRRRVHLPDRGAAAPVQLPVPGGHERQRHAGQGCAKVCDQGPQGRHCHLVE